MNHEKMEDKTENEIAALATMRNKFMLCVHMW